MSESPHTYTIRQKTPETNTHQLLVETETPWHAVSEKFSVAQLVWYGSAKPKVTGSIPVGVYKDKVKLSGPGVLGSPALSSRQ